MRVRMVRIVHAKGQVQLPTELWRSAEALGEGGNAKRPPETGDLSLQTGVVAGAARQRGAEGAVVAGGKAFNPGPATPETRKG